jgi:hypothetical protein
LRAKVFDNCRNIDLLTIVVAHRVPRPSVETWRA